MGISTTIIWVRYNYNYQLRDGFILFSSAKIWTGLDFGEFFKGCQVLKIPKKARKRTFRPLMNKTFDEANYMNFSLIC